MIEINLYLKNSKKVLCQQEIIFRIILLNNCTENQKPVRCIYGQYIQNKKEISVNPQIYEHFVEKYSSRENTYRGNSN